MTKPVPLRRNVFGLSNKDLVVDPFPTISHIDWPKWSGLELSTIVLAELLPELLDEDSFLRSSASTRPVNLVGQQPLFKEDSERKIIISQLTETLAEIKKRRISAEKKQEDLENDIRRLLRERGEILKQKEGDGGKVKLKVASPKNDTNQKLLEIKTGYSPFQQSHEKREKNLTTELKEIKCKINMRICQISATKKQTTFITKELGGILTNIEEKSWAAVVMAKIFIGQAKELVSANTKAAYPLAVVCSNLGRSHPLFAQILEFELKTICPYTIPVFRKEAEEEITATYIAQTCGILSFYSALLQTETLGKAIGLEKGWEWIAATLNTPPTKMSPFVVSAFLEIGGYAMLKKYGSQFLKILHLIRSHFLSTLPKEVLSTKTRLEIYLENVLEKRGGLIEEPKERNLPEE